MGLVIAAIILLGLTIGTTLAFKFLTPSFVSGEINKGEIIKKYELADIFKYRQTVFVSALLISLLFAWVLVEFKTYYSLNTSDDVLVNVEDEPIEIINTEMLPPPPPKPKTVVLEVVPDELILEDEDPPIEDPEDEPEPIEEEPEYADVPEEVVDNTIYNPTDLQQKAAFPGGEDALLRYVQSNYVMHSRDAHDETSGMIQVAFVVEKDGSISQVKVIRGLTSTANAEAERVVNSLPKWKPAKMGGLPVRMRFMVPLFLQGDN